MKRITIGLAAVIAFAYVPAYGQSLLGGGNSQGSGGSLLGGQGSAYGGNPGSRSVDGYTNSRGTYVQPHQQTDPNGTQYDNYGSKGVYNPNTGREGTRTPKY